MTLIAFERVLNELIKVREENKILKENAKHNDKVVDKVNWKNMLLKKENEQLQEKLLVSQTNEETFRLEMKDITKTLGLDEDILFDDVKVYVRSLKDNMFEKKQLKSLVNSCQEEIRQLKKQVEERTKMYQNAYDYSQKIEGKAIILETQQKEFIKYLEDERKRFLSNFNTDGIPIIEVELLDVVLENYKKIMGLKKWKKK